MTMASWMIDALAVAGLLAAILAAMPLLGRRSAAERHGLLAMGVAAALALPVVRAALPDRVHVPVATAPMPIANDAAAPRPPRADDGVAVTAAVVAPRQPPSDAPWRAVAVVWLAGVMVAGARLLFALLRIRRIAARATPIEQGPWRDALDDLRPRLGVAVPLRLLQSADRSLLATWGQRRPVVVLPLAAAAWDADRIRVVLAHELAHVARRDWLHQLLAEGLRALHWPNPLAWVACRRLRRESECASDDVVLSLGISAPDIASHLVTIARELRPTGWAPVPALIRPSSLEGRVRAMLDPTVVRRAQTTRSRWITAAATIAGAVALGSLGVAAQFHTLRGTLLDPTGRALVGAAVMLVNPAAGSRYELRSDASGRFEFVGVPPGDYQLEVRLLGFRNVREAVRVDGDAERTVRLSVGTLQETITVVGDGVPAAQPDEATLARRAAARARADARQHRALASCAAAAPATAGGQIVPPLKVVDVRPRYPEHLRPAGLAGTVTMRAVIDTTGAVREVRELRGPHPDFEKAAADAVRAWQFTTTLLNCEPIEVEMDVTVSFRAAP